jgi:hypothetical protein
MHTCTGLDEKYVFLLLSPPLFAPDRLSASDFAYFKIFSDFAYFEAYFKALESSGMLQKNGKNSTKK